MTAKAIKYSRWSHKCSCGRQVFWRKVYCTSCIKAYPPRGDFLLRAEQTRLGRRNLLGVGFLKGPFIVLKDGEQKELMCVACGKIMITSEKDNDLRHQCYWFGVRTQLYKKINCLICKEPKLRVNFAQLQRGTRKVRSRICATCLRASEVILSA